MLAYPLDDNGKMPYTLSPGPDVIGEIDVKASVFLTAIRRVHSVEGALAFIEERRRAHPDARHHCSAVIIGDDPAQRTERSSDDGEPGGTAGVPMLQVLHHRNVTNVAVVVTRWFGGIKLGAGGLVRAYSGAVATTLDGARLVHRIKRQEFTLDIDHALAGRTEAELRGRGVSVLDVSYRDHVRFQLAGSHDLPDTVATITSGTGVLRPAGVGWIDQA